MGSVSREVRYDCAVCDCSPYPARIQPSSRRNPWCSAARCFVLGKRSAFTCFDGTRGAGRVYDDGSVIGVIQFQGSGLVRSAWLPPGTLKVKGETVCASLNSIPIEPCFDLSRTDESKFPRLSFGIGFRLLRLHPAPEALLIEAPSAAI